MKIKHCRRSLQGEEPTTLVARYPVLRNKRWHQSKFYFLYCSDSHLLKHCTSFMMALMGAKQGCNCITAKGGGGVLLSLWHSMFYISFLWGELITDFHVLHWAHGHHLIVVVFFFSTKIAVLTKSSVVRATFLILQLVFGSDLRGIVFQANVCVFSFQCARSPRTKWRSLATQASLCPLKCTSEIR